MERKKILIGVVIVSVIIAAGLTVMQSRVPSYVQMEKTTDVSGIAYPEAEYAQEALMEQSPSVPAEKRAPSEQQVIKTSYISLEVEEFRKAADAIGEIARKYGGYVSDSSVQNIGERKTGYVTVRVPGENFEEATKEIEQVGTLKEENISLEDVTEQYIDLNARLDNLKRQEERYLEILKMATTVEDVLKVETQLERVRGEIESLQGILNYLNNRISLSTIQVQLSEPVEVVHEPGIRDAFNRAIDGFLAAIRGIIIFLGYFVPIAIFLTIVALAGWFIYRKVSRGR